MLVIPSSGAHHDVGIAQIGIAGKRQLKEARDRKDDWTGKTDAKERRKAQNRLHQRAWRRKKLEAKQNNTVTTEYGLAPSQPTDDALLFAFAAATASFIPNTSPKQPPATSPTALPLTTPYGPPPPSPHTKPYPPLIPYLSPSSLSLPRTANNFLPFLPFHTSTFLTIPPSFPLSADHHLLTLIQYNVMRAILENMVLCNIMAAMPLECRNALMLPLAHAQPATPPPTFRRSKLQMHVRHPNWIDCFPCERMRDNLILASADSVFPAEGEFAEQAGSRKERRTFDADDLCADTCGGLYDGLDDCVARGLLVWGEPWQVESWEISEGFARKWGWLLEGCEDLVRATNAWRAARGEEGIVLGEV